MLDFLEKLRSKSDGAKKNIAFFTSMGITVIIFVFWITSRGVMSTDNKINLAKEAKSPISSLTASVGDIFVYIKDIFTGGNKIDYKADDSIEALPKQ